MLIIGCDFHTRYQQIAMADDATGELIVERRLNHENGKANTFHRSLPKPVRVGIEATGPMHWFEQLLASDPAIARGSKVPNQPSDRRNSSLYFISTKARFVNPAVETGSTNILGSGWTNSIRWVATWTAFLNNFW